MAIKRELRQEVFAKYGGRCAYCGCGLEKLFHVDHIEAHWHNMSEQRCAESGIKKGADIVENMNPSCPRCNRWKGTFNIEQFRNEIAEQVMRLNRYSNNYRLAKDYNLVSETKLNVIFYFETLKTPKNMKTAKQFVTENQYKIIARKGPYLDVDLEFVTKLVEDYASMVLGNMEAGKNNNKLMKEALQEIANPIDYFQKELKEGKIDSRKAIALSNDAEYLKFTAKKALKRCTDYNGF